MTHSPTNEPKTAEQMANELCKKNCWGDSDDHGGNDFVSSEIVRIMKLYAKQEGRELIEALEKVLGIADRKTVEFDAARKTVSIWKARNQ